jgi:hypothetical protein
MAIPAALEAITLTYALLLPLLLLLLLQGFEAIKGVLLEPEEFSVDNDCLTPTFKFKRPQLQKRYQVRPAATLGECCCNKVQSHTVKCLAMLPSSTAARLHNSIACLRPQHTGYGPSTTQQACLSWYAERRASSCCCCCCFCCCC